MVLVPVNLFRKSAKKKKINPTFSKEYPEYQLHDASEEGDRFIRSVIKLLFFDLRGGAASKIILGCWVVGLLSEQGGWPKTDSEG